MGAVLTVFRGGNSIFPHDVDLELVGGTYRPTELIEIHPDDTFVLSRTYEPRVTPERAERDDAARAHRESRR